ncbi:DUF167 family protein [Roseibium suaedae]|uniref:UPF0235 protein SAMN05444272_3700 n=1 Tax=Roseibium suaedae TaxID=735517 RepID=A0A1M7N4T0_9HYPH|nr:DUF167 family protein [Roseibium suaedae]SHM98435.1 hypothetical protein SAMN05444272_3700 [Roseibium suaedae]
MSGAAKPWRLSGDDILIDVRLTPKAAKDGVDGLEILSDGRPVLKARVRAVPEKGAANKALTQLMAKTLGLPKSAVALDSGSTSRLKTLRIANPDADTQAQLDALCAEPSS